MNFNFVMGMTDKTQINIGENRTSLPMWLEAKKCGQQKLRGICTGLGRRQEIKRESRTGEKKVTIKAQYRQAQQVSSKT